MFFFETYLFKTVRCDLVNTFFCQNITKIPKLKKIILNFGYQKSNFRSLITSLLALEFISYKKGIVTKSKHINVFLKIKKGNPVGCKLILKKTAMNFFFIKLKTSISPSVKQSQIYQHQQKVGLRNSISFQIKNPLLFTELENQFQFIKDVPQLDITLLTDSESQKELLYLLKSIKLFS